MLEGFEGMEGSVSPETTQASLGIYIFVKLQAGRLFTSGPLCCIAPWMPHLALVRKPVRSKSSMGSGGLSASLSTSSSSKLAEDLRLRVLLIRLLFQRLRLLHALVTVQGNAA